MDYHDSKGGRVSFRLVDRILPRCQQLATALGFPQHTIDVMMKLRGDEPVWHLLNEWLSGTSQEGDSKKPITWRTLIEALRRAKMHEEVTILTETEFIFDSDMSSESGELLLCIYLHKYMP